MCLGGEGLIAEPLDPAHRFSDSEGFLGVRFGPGNRSDSEMSFLRHSNVGNFSRLGLIRVISFGSRSARLIRSLSATIALRSRSVTTHLTERALRLSAPFETNMLRDAGFVATFRPSKKQHYLSSPSLRIRFLSRRVLCAAHNSGSQAIHSGTENSCGRNLRFTAAESIQRLTAQMI